ncbi:3-deoxy-manno-octulosonate cytidylyltransferase [Methylophilus sp. Leaf408]|uniref:3-deoxy-manno-octulosonate cytidylyltransferase n=1 Tax=Methylophilus sp. Leaf408 TaxID=2876561 RepID=UPI001E4854AC|nr:3-deoxy-manno-octulosonate cytidylyltransferase [Methylophilus sp. Leaf408]
MQQKIIIVIPARYASTRFPAKPLALLLGKPMVQHVYEKAKQVENIADVIVATDDARILQAVEQFGGKAMMTSENHQSGTDRLIEVMKAYPADAYINVQGDEPLIRPEDIALLVTQLGLPETQVATLCHKIHAEEAKNPNFVKVVLNQYKQALYFSRSPIPYPRNAEHAAYYKHVGVYAYKRHVLEQFYDLPFSALENAESLEQLRLLEAGIPIQALTVDETGPGVDTPQDLKAVEALLTGNAVVITENPLANIKLVITDVDGVLTDGGLYYNQEGEFIKRFHVRDGLGIRMLIELGIQVAVVSGRDSAVLRKRIADLGITRFKLGVKDKFQACNDLMQDCGVNKEQTATLGDDSIDLPAFKACGVRFAVADSADYVKQHATHVLKLGGGHGAFREASDAILIAKGMSDVLSTTDGYARIMDMMVQ